MKKIAQQQIQRRLSSENPWWGNRASISEVFFSFEPRAYLDLFFPLISEASKHRAVVLLGPRRVGKTVMIHHTIQKLIQSGTSPQNILYCSIDSPIYNGLSLDDILHEYAELNGVNLETDEVYVFFDEIQYLKNWEQHLKSLVDLRRALRFCVSGSAAAALKLKSQESGAGRFTDFLLPPLTFYEYLKLLGKSELIQIEDMVDKKASYTCHNLELLNEAFTQYLNFGGYPEIALIPDLQADPARFIKSDIIDKVLLRDLPSLYGIQDIQELNSLFTTLAFNTANEVSLESLSQNSGVAKNTIKRYIEYLEAAFLIRIVHRVDQNAKRFNRANFFKVYLTNPSIRSALFGPLDNSDEAIGDVVETALYSQWFHADMATMHYARWGNGEVDMVYLNSDQTISWAWESKWSNRYFEKPSELKSLLSFCHKNNLGSATVTTISQQGSKLIENVHLNFVPAAILTCVVGAILIDHKRLEMFTDLALEQG